MKHALFFSIIIIFIITSCSDREMPSKPSANPKPVLSIVEAPEKITFNRSYRIAIKVIDAQGKKDVPFVTSSIYLNDSSFPSRIDTLWDDGQELKAGDGDVVAFDGIFTQMFMWPSGNKKNQDLTLTFAATDNSGHKSDTLQHVVTYAEIPQPKLVDVSVPDFLASGFEGQKLITATVDSENAIKVFMRGKRVNAPPNFPGLLNFSEELYDNGEHGDA